MVERQTDSCESFEPSIISVPVTSSSEKQELTACVPGRSIILCSILLYVYFPNAASTVFPDQLPVCCFSPVKALKTVLFPTLGLPRR